MKALLRLSLAVVAAPAVLFFLWMNLTPGHFQYQNCCGCHTKGDNVRYLPTEYFSQNCGAIACIESICWPTRTDQIKLVLARFDFFK